MAERTTTSVSGSNRSRTMSPWPPFVALGLALSEVGVVMNLASVSVGGILLLGGSIAGILVDASYVDSPWLPLGVLGGLFTVAGGAIWWSQLQVPFGLDAMLAVAHTDAVAMRGQAILVAGLLLVLATIGGIVYKSLASANT
ncbi:MAG: cox cluster protein [Halanaeroarchaeum sp.]